MDDLGVGLSMDLCSPVVPLKRRRSENVTSISTSMSTSTSSISMSTSMTSATQLDDLGHGHGLSTSTSSTSNTSRTRGHSGERVNPFEPFCLRNMKASIFSPSVFLTSTPTTKLSSGFTGWDVNELAELFPKSLESSPTSHTNPWPTDSRTEARVQEEITEFFSSGPIAPTPDDVPRKKNYLYRSPLRLPPPPPQGEEGEVKGSQAIVAATADSWANTVLSLPPGRMPPELEAALGPYFTVECCSETEIKICGPPERMVPVTVTPEPPPLPQTPLDVGVTGNNGSIGGGGGDLEEEEEFGLEGDEGGRSNLNLLMEEEEEVDEVGVEEVRGEGLLEDQDDEDSQSSQNSYRMDRGSVGMSVRRRLELSFGESSSNPVTPIRATTIGFHPPMGSLYGDPFGGNRDMISPVLSSRRRQNHQNPVVIQQSLDSSISSQLSM